jgi:hypothetical protein
MSAEAVLATQLLLKAGSMLVKSGDDTLSTLVNVAGESDSSDASAIAEWARRAVDWAGDGFRALRDGRDVPKQKNALPALAAADSPARLWEDAWKHTVAAAVPWEEIGEGGDGHRVLSEDDIAALPLWQRYFYNRDKEQADLASQWEEAWANCPPPPPDRWNFALGATPWDLTSVEQALEGSGIVHGTGGARAGGRGEGMREMARALTAANAIRVRREQGRWDKHIWDDTRELTAALVRGVGFADEAWFTERARVQEHLRAHREHVHAPSERGPQSGIWEEQKSLVRREMADDSRTGSRPSYWITDMTVDEFCDCLGTSDGWIVVRSSFVGAELGTIDEAVGPRLAGGPYRWLLHPPERERFGVVCAWYPSPSRTGLDAWEAQVIRWLGDAAARNLGLVVCTSALGVEWLLRGWCPDDRGHASLTRPRPPEARFDRGESRAVAGDGAGRPADESGTDDPVFATRPEWVAAEDGALGGGVGKVRFARALFEPVSGGGVAVPRGRHVLDSRLLPEVSPEDDSAAPAVREPTQDVIGHVDAVLSVGGIVAEGWLVPAGPERHKRLGGVGASSMLMERLRREEPTARAFVACCREMLRAVTATPAAALVDALTREAASFWNGPLLAGSSIGLGIDLDVARAAVAVDTVARLEQWRAMHGPDSLATIFQPIACAEWFRDDFLRMLDGLLRRSAQRDQIEVRHLPAALFVLAREVDGRRDRLTSAAALQLLAIRTALSLERGRNERDAIEPPWALLPAEDAALLVRALRSLALEAGLDEGNEGEVAAALLGGVTIVRGDFSGVLDLQVLPARPEADASRAWPEPPSFDPNPDPGPDTDSDPWDGRLVRREGPGSVQGGEIPARPAVLEVRRSAST